MTFAGAVDDPSLIRRIGLRKKRVEQMHRVVQEIIIRFADPNRELASKLRSKRLPVLLEHYSQIILFPMLGQFVIDLTCLRLPERNGASIRAARSVSRVPGAPLLARHRVAVTQSHDVFHLALVTNSEAHVAVEIASARAFKSMPVQIRVLIVVDVDQLKRAE